MRKVRRMSQSKLGAAIGSDQKEISRYEAGKHLPSVDRLISIAAAFGVEVRDLFPSNKLNEGLAPPALEAATIIDELAKTDPKLAALAVRILRAIIAK